MATERGKDPNEAKHFNLTGKRVIYKFDANNLQEKVKVEELSIELKKKSKFTFSTSSRNGRRSLARCLRGLEVMSCNTVFGKKSKKIFADDGDMNINHKTKTAENSNR
ncbi:hypothetical protein RRG08_035034 [Elysia crispata]|uniref:Uncharacterized protein n=1 Tax=Elysia crispata TaxID=231223 RepID=A0AAE0ZS62_9GAST|nr:hypothetical protein RRG08_035034 [Elysia crispata]